MKPEKPWTILLVLAVAACTAGVSAVAGGKVKTEEENVVASRLVGTWKTDLALSSRLNGRGVRGEVIKFAEDASVAGKVPESYTQNLKAKQIYLSGIMTRNDGTAYPFILTEYYGNPRLIYFREKNGDPMGDGESFTLFVAPADDREKDLLFIGGDFNKQSFIAYERIDGEENLFDLPEIEVEFGEVIELNQVIEPNSYDK